MRARICLGRAGFGAALFVLGVFGIGNIANADVVRNLGTLGIGANVLTSGTVGATACTGGGGGLPAPVSGFTHQIHFDVALGVIGAAVNQTITGISVASMNLYALVDANNVAGGADASTASLIATGVSSGGGLFFNLTSLLGSGAYFVEIVGTVNAANAAYDQRVGVSAVPLPPALLLLGAALLGLIGVGRVRRARAAA